MEHDIEPFAGFGPRAVSFFQDLEDSNSKAFFDEHREVYESHVREPMERLLAEVAKEFGIDGKVFRPNRDIRFSKDKSPYKLHCGAVVGDDSPGSPIFYTHVGTEGLRTASGYYRMSRDQVQRFYEAVDHDRTGPELQRLVEAARDDGIEVGGSVLKTSPRGYPNDHPRVELLRHKGLTLSRAWPEYKWLQTREALRRITALWRDARPINDWLVEHVGAARDVDPGRP